MTTTIDEILKRVRAMSADPATANERLLLLDEVDALLPPLNKYQEIVKLAASMTDDQTRVGEREQLMAEARRLLAEMCPPAPMPPAKFVDDAGKSVYTIEQSAEQLECTVDEARWTLTALAARAPGAKVKGNIHRLH